MKHTVTEHRLAASGARGLVIDVPGSAVVSLQVRFNSGFQFADPKRYEVPHVMEHVLATVTRRHAEPNAFIIAAQKNGAYVNASTSVDANGYIYECAAFELERILDLVEEQLTLPLFEGPHFEAEVSNVREELTRNTTQHGSVCSVALAQAAFPGQWLSYEQRIEQLSGIRLSHIRAHFERTHTAANGRFLVAGSFPDGGRGLARRLERVFGQMPAGRALERSRMVGENVDQPVVTRRDIAQLYYRAAWYFGELDNSQRRALSLLRMVLVGGMGSRVLGEARRRGLAYGVGGTGHAQPGNSSFGFVGYVTPKHADPLFELVAREFAAVRAGRLTQAELTAAQDLLVGQVQRSTQTPGDILSWYLDAYEETGEIRDFDYELQQLRQVSVDEVVKVAQIAVADGRQGVSFLGPVTAPEARRYAKLLRSQG